MATCEMNLPPLVLQQQEQSECECMCVTSGVTAVEFGLEEDV